MKKRASIQLTKSSRKPVDVLVLFMFIFYFGHGLIQLGYRFILGTNSGFFVIYNLVFFGCIALYALIRSRKNLAPALICLIAIALIFGITYLIHPEYKGWFFEKTYGIQVQFLRGMGGIWAFWIICMAPDRDDLMRYLRVAVWILFIYCTYRFIDAQQRGYWYDYNAHYELIKSQYNLGFGYDVMFCSLFFVCEAFIGKKLLYYIPYVFGAIMILLSGSRGALIWLVLIFPMMLIFKWREMKLRGRLGTVLLLILLAGVAVVLYSYFDQIMNALSGVLSSVGIDSRTLTRLSSGQFAELSGRDTIWRITWEQIKTGGLFGRGAF